MKKIDTLQFAEKAKKLANHENEFFYKGKTYTFHGYIPPSINMRSRDGYIIKKEKGVGERGQISP